ncbi:uracil-DNA glycosylase family protein [Snodgrassella alvi]|uniref:uracil-DNA glycosylase n=1 Tax=Snodgrassella alvi TaxID=1196083 RepID=UPI00351C5790
MLNSRYLYLHEALGLGPMWLSQTAYLIPSEITETNTPVKNDTRSVARSAPDNSVHLEPVRTSHQTSPADISATQPANRHRDALRQIINQPATESVTQITKEDNTSKISPITTSDKLNISFESIPATLAACTRCNLHQERCTPLPGYGASNARLLVISSNPAPPDDSSRQLFSGEVGKLLSNMLAAINITAEEVFFTSQVKCAPNVSLRITDEHLQACLPYLNAQIEHIRPQAILLLGQIFSQLDQTILAHNLHNIPYVISPHPARLLRQSHLKANAWTALKQLRNFLQ